MTRSRPDGGEGVDTLITLHRIRFLDLMLIIATSGIWALWVFWFNEVKVEASAIAKAAAQ